MTCNSDNRNIPSFDQAPYRLVVWCTTDEMKKMLRDEPRRSQRDLYWRKLNRLLFIRKIVKVEVPGLAKEDKEQVAEDDAKRWVSGTAEKQARGKAERRIQEELSYFEKRRLYFMPPKL